MVREQPLPRNFGDYAVRSYDAVARTTALPWWDTCITSAFVDLTRVEGFVHAFVGIAKVLRDGEHPDWVVGGASVRAAIAVAIEWLDADVDATEVGAWLRAGCWDPKTARRLVDVGIRPSRLLDEEGKPAHWVEAPDGGRIPLAQAVVEWHHPIADLVRHVTGWGYEVHRSQTS